MGSYISFGTLNISKVLEDITTSSFMPHINRDIKGLSL